MAGMHQKPRRGIHCRVFSTGAGQFNMPWGIAVDGDDNVYLLSRMDEHTSVLVQSLSMLVLGAGIGLVMQVLTIVVQNTSDYRDLTPEALAALKKANDGSAARTRCEDKVIADYAKAR